jgi:hypothetical protein
MDQQFMLPLLAIQPLQPQPMQPLRSQLIQPLPVVLIPTPAKAANGKKAAKKKLTKEVTPSKNWTVRRGNIDPPTSDDYKDWNLEQLRRECTARDKVIECGIDGECDQRVSFLEEGDNDREIVAGLFDPEMLLPPAKRQKQSDNIRMCNVLFSDLLAGQFARCEDQKERQQLDSGGGKEKSLFWFTAADENANNETDYNGLYVDDPQYAGIDPPQRTSHDAAKLHKMWKNLLTLYREAYRKSTTSGNHSPFIDYCDGRLDVAYVDACVRVRQNLAGFCRGGMPEGTRFDSENLGTASHRRTRDTESKL